MSKESSSAKQTGKSKTAEKPNPKISQRPTPQVRTRNNASSDTGRSSVADIRTDQTELIKDVDSAKAYLIQTAYIAPGLDITVTRLIDVLFYLSSDKSANKSTTNIARAVAFLLEKCDLRAQSFAIANAINSHLETLWEDNEAVSAPIKEATKTIEEVVTKTISFHVDKRLDKMKKKMTDSLDALSASIAKISDTSNPYRQALLQPTPPLPLHLPCYTPRS